MPQYRISNAARADILRFSQTQFGDQARQRYQALILSKLQAIADTPYRIGSHDRDELAPGLRSYHLIYSRQQAKHMERSKARAMSCSIAWQTTT